MLPCGMARVIIAEDEGLVARSLAQLLTQHGHDVPASVGTGADAVTAATTASPSPDLVLMDVRLRGDMDGIEAARRIRLVRDIPIVFLTAYADRVHLERAKSSAPHAYLLKPYNDRELLTTIEVVLHKHRLERELRERERWLGTTLRSIRDGVIAVDPQQRVELLNDEAERLTGWALATAAGASLDQVLYLAARDGSRRMLPLERAMRDGASHGLDEPIIVRARDGGERPVEASVAAIGGDGGDVLGAVIILRDLTERRMLEARLALADRVSSLATLTAGIGHELNNPLSGNLANLELALEAVARLQAAAGDRPVAPAELRPALDELGELLRDARTGAARMRDVLGTLSALGPGEGRGEPVALADVVEAAIRLAGDELAHRVYVVRELRAAPLVHGHGGQLCQLVTNLLVNAAQAVPEDGAPPRPVRVVVDATERDAIVEVIDAGVGIPPELLERIFEPFFSTRPVGIGSGLGLPIAHHIAQAHHGEITVRSKVGEGTAFRVRLPRAAAAPAPAVVSPPSGPAPEARPARVLVVDDEPIVARMLGRTLADDHDVTVVTSGAEALAAIEAAPPDVIVSDIMMPGISGIELHERVRARWPALADRMIFVTGGAFTPATQAFVAAMGERVLLKPFDPARLLAAVAGRVPRRS